MTFLALLLALILLHYQPLGKINWLGQLFSSYTRWLDHQFNGGNKQHGIVAWLLGVLLPTLAVSVCYYAVEKFNALSGLILSIAILYLSLDFGQFGRNAESIAVALRDNNFDHARQLLADWQQTETVNNSLTEIARKSILLTLRQSHSGLFAPIFWFMLLGPAGVVMYQLANATKIEWQPSSETPFNRFARKALGWLDWPPAFVTAGSFAIVGDFEDAAYCWRTQAPTWPEKTEGIVLAAGAGALGVRLGEPETMDGLPQPELGLGDEADADYVKSAVGLVWRTLILIMGLLLLLTFANWLGS